MLQIDLDKFLNQFLYDPQSPLIFSSGLFVWLFLGFLVVYSFVFKYQKAKVLFVTAFSLYFYYKSSGIYFLLLVITTLVDFLLARRIGNTETHWKRKALLMGSICFNLGVLLYFKYTNFFADLWFQLIQSPFSGFDIFLPVGVSFFTFQSMSYTIDVYRKELKALENPIDYAFFVSFFPQLVAGPIVRAVDFIPQIFKPVVITKEMFGKGVFLICIGLIKKAIIADYISINFVDRVFDQPLLYTGFENLMAVYGYALQIYCDFSGYSDMAIGIALLIGFEFTLNFNSPYKSVNITDFWRRWHISLSSWLRGYLYISLGGNRKGKIRTYFNLFITMVLGGLWHGAALRFVIWGALHGLALALHKFLLEKWQWLKGDTSVLVRILSILITFHFVCFCWIFFRASSVEMVGQVLHQIGTQFQAHILLEFLAGYKVVCILIAVGYLAHFIPAKWKLSQQDIVQRTPFWGQVSLIMLAILILTQFKSSEIQPFIYFQF